MQFMRKKKNNSPKTAQIVPVFAKKSINIDKNFLYATETK